MFCFLYNWIQWIYILHIHKTNCKHNINFILDEIIYVKHMIFVFVIRDLVGVGILL